MNNEQLQLIQAGADGELDAAGQAELDALLEHSAAAREQHETLLRLNAFLGQVPSLDPPESLHGRIVGAIKLPKPAGGGLAERFNFMPGLLRYGFAAGLAVVVTMAVYQGGSQLNGVDYDKLVGTISARGAELDRFDFSEPGVQGSVRLLERGDQFALEFDLDAEGPVRFDVNFSQSGLRFDAFAQADLNLDEMSLTKNSLVGRTAGSQRFVVLMRPDASADAPNGQISLEFFQADASLARTLLTTRP